jgi:hypothetical protein
MPRPKKSETGRPIESYDHAGKERLNNPPIGTVTPDTYPDAGKRSYAYDPHLDPQLQWAGKAEHTSFEVPTGSLHVHIRLSTDDVPILETKGQEAEQDRVKRRYLDEWVQAVNQQSGLGCWRWDVAKQRGDVLDILARHCVCG